MPSIPGFPAPLKALTVVPFGMEEGTDIRIPGREFGLVVGEPAEFRFFTSATRKNDQPGDLIEDFGDDLEELVAHGSQLQPGENSVGSGARLLRDRGHRNRHAATLVRGPRRPPLEAGIQREGTGVGQVLDLPTRKAVDLHRLPDGGNEV